MPKITGSPIVESTTAVDFEAATLTTFFPTHFVAAFLATPGSDLMLT